MTPSASVLEAAETAMISRRVTAAIAQAQSNGLQAFREAKEYSERAAKSLRSYFPYWEARSEAWAARLPRSCSERGNSGGLL